MVKEERLKSLPLTSNRTESVKVDVMERSGEADDECGVMVSVLEVAESVFVSCV